MRTSRRPTGTAGVRRPPRSGIQNHARLHERERETAAPAPKERAKRVRQARAVEEARELADDLAAELPSLREHAGHHAARRPLAVCCPVTVR